MDYIGKLIRLKSLESLRNTPLININDGYYDGWEVFARHLGEKHRIEGLKHNCRYEESMKHYKVYSPYNIPSFSIEEITGD